MQVQIDKLDKITIFTEKEAITLKKYPETIAAFISSFNESVRLSDSLVKIDNLLI